MSLREEIGAEAKQSVGIKRNYLGVFHRNFHNN